MRYVDFCHGLPNPKVLAYFKQKSAEYAISYQTLINLYLQDCRTKRRNLKLKLAP